MKGSRANLRLSLITTTLTELLLLLFFVILLFGLGLYVKESRAAERYREEARHTAQQLEEALVAVEIAEAQLSEMSEILGEARDWPKDFQRLIRTTVQARADQGLVRDALAVKVENRLLKAQLGALETELSEKQLEIGGLQTALEASTTAEAAATIARLSGEAAASQVRVSGLQEQLEAGSLERTELRRHLDDRTAQVKFMRARQDRAGTGMDHPPCWVDQAGQIEYLLTVAIREEGVDAEPRWPPHRDTDAEGLPALELIIGGLLDPKEFALLAQPILEWSKAQDPECRHFAWLQDRAVSKDAYKTGRLSVESVFYKYEERDARRASDSTKDDD